MAFGVDLFVGLVADTADGRDAPVEHTDIGAVGGMPVPSTTIPFRITRS